MSNDRVKSIEINLGGPNRNHGAEIDEKVNALINSVNGEVISVLPPIQLGNGKVIYTVHYEEKKK